MANGIVINFDYAAAKLQADTLEQLSERLKNLAATDMERVLGDIDSSWKGTNATEFLKKGDQMKEKILRSSRQLYNVAEAIRTISETTRKAEEAAALIAQSSGE